MNFQNLWRERIFFCLFFTIAIQNRCEFIHNLSKEIMSWTAHCNVVNNLLSLRNSFYILLLWIFWQEFNNFFSFILQVVKEEKISVVDMQKLRQIIIKIITKRLWKRKEENKKQKFKKWMVCPLCLKASVGF